MKRAPVYFLAHGSPMNALAKNEFTKNIATLRALFPNPKAIVCVSAHWITDGAQVTRMERPKTIHDFYGFPQELFNVQYPAPGSVEVADRICDLIPGVHADESEWGLDHGTWSVLVHLFPQANIPVLQLSLDANAAPEDHWELGAKLRPLRDEGVLIIGSGNIVHNLSMIDWNQSAAPFPWAREFDEMTKAATERRDRNALLNDFYRTQVGRMSAPTPEHFFPLFYVMGAADEKDQLQFAHEGIDHGSIDMRSVVFKTA